MNLEDLYRLLRSGHIQAQGIVDTLDQPLVVLDNSFCVLSANPAFFETFAVVSDDTIGRSLFDLGNGQWNIPELVNLFSEILPKSLAVVGYEVTHTFPVLGRRHILVSARRLVQAENNRKCILVVFHDSTEERRNDREHDILLAETRHRMKNLLGIVRALASQTAVEGRSGKEYRDAFLGRFETVIKAQELSLEASKTDLAALIGQVTEPMADRVQLDPGPTVTFEPAQAFAVSMILHELTTNAIKHGALSTPTGLVRIAWSVTPSGEARTMRLQWRESGGPAVTPPTRQGFGTRLIDFSAREELGGSVELHFEPEGLRVSLDSNIA